MTIKKTNKKFFLTVFLLIFSLLLSSCSLFSLPDDKPDEPENPNGQVPQTEPKEFAVAYFSGENLDPYESENRANRAVIALCYEGLISLDAQRNPVPQTADYTFDNTTAVFTVKDSARFCDGTAVTASDIVYSFEKASKSSLYSFRFEKYIAGWKIVSENSVSVTFKIPNVWNINLFDFPIIKKVSNGIYPEGSGKYRLSEENGKLSLIKNKYYKNSEAFKTDVISLVEINDAQDLNYNFNYGVIHAAYADLSDGAQRYKGNVELVTFMTNSMVFAVVNKSKPYLSSNRVSEAISRCIDRKTISEKTLDSLGDIVWQPFNLNWGELVNKDIKKNIYSASDANGLFSENGLVLNGTRRFYKNEPIEITVICNNEDITRVRITNAVADSLREMGFSVNVVLYNWNDYKKVIESGEYDVYIAETNVPDNFDIRYMLSDKLVNTQTEASAEFSEALNGFYEGNSDISGILTAFNSEMPFIPLFYNRGALAVNRIISGDFSPTEYSIFNGIETWETGKTD